MSIRKNTYGDLLCGQAAKGANTRVMVWQVLAILLSVTTFPGAVDAQVDLDNLDNYANQFIPDYITKDNTPVDNPITDAGATLGRVLFYDKQLSSNHGVACASCHQQENAFSDLDQLSQGVNGLTGRHSMRLINARFSDETNAFWDERAGSLEEQATQPIRNHEEMGFSGANGDPTFDDLITRLETLPYYKALFRQAFGDQQITEERMQKSIAQFVRSIQSFDSKFDQGRAQVQNNRANFPNFTASENAGKRLFMDPFQFQTDTLDGVTVSRRVSGGLNCASCHQGSEMSISPRSGNIGLTDVVNSLESDFTVTRAPSLRDVVKADGELNGGMFHTGLGTGTDISAMIDHYNAPPVDPDNPNMDDRLLPGGNPQFLNMTDTERIQLNDFLKTLAGSDVYTNAIWSTPFDEQGNLIVLGVSGDFESDGDCTTDDLDMLVNALLNQSTDLQFDMDGSGLIDENDLSQWLIDAALFNDLASPYSFADGNLDGEVDNLDLQILLENYGDAGAWSTGDYNIDGTINGADIVFWQRQYTVSLSTTLATTTTVPEPSTCWLMLLVALGLLIRRSRPMPRAFE